MSELNAIPVITAGGGCASNLQTAHNATPVLHEIRHALQQLSQGGEPTTIDLTALPFGPGDRDQLFAILGTGEVSATLDTAELGITEITETGFHGVWCIRHLGPSDEELAIQIEVTRLPTLLLTPNEDIVESAAALSNEFTHIEETS